MGSGHASDSAVPRRVEEQILKLASEVLHFELKHRVWTEARTTLPDGARIDVDGYRLRTHLPSEHPTPDRPVEAHPWGRRRRPARVS